VLPTYIAPLFKLAIPVVIAFCVFTFCMVLLPVFIGYARYCAANKYTLQ